MTLHSTGVLMPFKRIPTFEDGKGGRLTVSRSYSGSVSRQVTAGADYEVDAVFEKAKVSISASLTKTNSTSATHTYSHSIPAGRWGHARYVSYGKRIRYRKWEWNHTCTQQITLARGTIKFPTHSEGWHFWTTAKP